MEYSGSLEEQGLALAHSSKVQSFAMAGKPKVQSFATTGKPKVQSATAEKPGGRSLKPLVALENVFRAGNSDQ